MKKSAKKPNLFTRTLALAVTAALVLGALALVAWRDRFNLDALKRWLAYNALTAGEARESQPFTHAGGDKLDLACLNSGFLISSDAGARYYSFQGELYTEAVQVLENPVLESSATTGVVYSAGEGSLNLFRNAEKTSLSLDRGGIILSARVNDSGWLALTAQQSGHKGVVNVYNGVGECVFEIKLSSIFLVDAAVSPDGKTVAAVTMDQSEGSFRSQVFFFALNQEEPIAQIDLGSAAVLDLDYESGYLWVLGEDRLSIISTEDWSTSTYSFSRAYLKGCSLGGEGFALLLTGRYRVGSSTQAVVVGPDGTASPALDVADQVLDYDCAGNSCAILTGSRLALYDSTLTQYASLDDTQGARRTALSVNGSALLANSQQAWLFIP